MGRLQQEFTVDVYRRAAQSNMEFMNELYTSGHIVAAYYLAGVAVECVLLSYLLDAGLQREDHHNLIQLEQRSGFIRGFSNEATQEDLTADLAEMASLWQNSHRYRSEELLRKFLNRRGLFEVDGKRVKGDIVKFHAVRILDAATRIVTYGVQRWIAQKRPN